MPFKKTNSSASNNRIGRFSAGAIGVSVIVGLIVIGVNYFQTDAGVLYTVHQGLKIERVERSGPTAFWVAPAQEPALADGKLLYGTFCAFCHGAKMEGQPNWRSRMANGRLPAPPHNITGHTWHHPDAQLLSMIKDGFVPGVTAPIGYESNMPAFGAALSDIQIKTILAYIKTYWPDDALDAQREISLQ
jgi:S-disulfanyl-L-cysteine oxidoreductase SoxD|uniref:c-type cytochrome n=1 Tax=Orrella sp. TaxID=1921583 RepID=UPI004048C3E9